MLIIEQCKDCLYHITVTTRVDNLETDVKALKTQVQGIHTSVELQKQSTETILTILSELKDSIKRVENVLSDKKDLFKETIYDLGIWAVKLAVLVGGVYAIASKVKGV